MKRNGGFITKQFDTALRKTQGEILPYPTIFQRSLPFSPSLSSRVSFYQKRRTKQNTDKKQCFKKIKSHVIALGTDGGRMRKGKQKPLSFLLPEKRIFFSQHCITIFTKSLAKDYFIWFRKAFPSCKKRLVLHFILVFENSFPRLP